MTSSRPARSRLVSTVRGVSGRRRFRDVKAYCMFIGYSRSGHSLLGALLDAHPRMVISHELDGLGLIAEGYGRLALFETIRDHDAAFTAAGRQWHGYDYRVPGQWQGRFDVLEVIGDKKGGTSSLRLAREPGLLDQLRRVAGVPLRLIHHVRNPFDNIATIASGVNEPLEAAINRYLEMCSAVSSVLAGCDDEEVIEVHHEEFVNRPREQLHRICRFLGEQTSSGYLDDCATVVFPTARRTRDNVEWTPEAVRRVDQAIAVHPFLSGYEL